MIASVLAFAMMASFAAGRPIPPEAAEALRTASEAAGGLESSATHGSLDVRSAVLIRVHRLQEEAGLWADAAATAERMATGSHGRETLAKSLARAGAIDKAATIADTLKGEARDQVLVVLAAVWAKTDPGAARAMAAELGTRAAALADAGRPGLALEVMEAVRETSVGEWALIRVAKAQSLTGDLAGARATTDGRLKTRGGRVPTLCAVARALKDAGRRDEAVAALREAEATAGGIEPDLAAIGTLATALHKAGRRDEARRWADRASDAVDSTVYAYVSGSDLGTVMHGRERRLEQVGTIYADLGLPAMIWPLVARCDPQDDGVEACLRLAARVAAASDPASVAARRDDPALSATGRAAIRLGFAEGLIANGRRD